MKPWVWITLICAAIVFILFIIGQVLWLRAKVKDFDRTKLTSQMTQQALIASSNKQSNLNLYSVVLDIPHTLQLNNKSTLEYGDMIPIVAPQTFNVPHVCGGVITSAHLSCNDPAFICMKNTYGAEQLLLDVKNGSIMYVMINGLYYLVTFDERAVVMLIANYPMYANNMILTLFTVNSASNIVLDATTSCTIELVPFFGALSTVNALQSINIDSKKQEQQFHVLGYLM